MQAAEYTYKRSFKQKGLGSGSESELDTAECSICMDKLKEKESSTGGTSENEDPNVNEDPNSPVETQVFTNRNN